MASGLEQGSPSWLKLLQAGLLVASFSPVPAVEVDKEDGAWVAYDQALRSIREGAGAGRRRALREAVQALHDLETSQSTGTQRRSEQELWSLWEVLHADADDWYATRFVGSLGPFKSVAAREIRLEALSSASRNLQARAVAHLALHADPQARARLEALWQDDPPTWVLPNLIRALLAAESDRHVEGFRRLAHEGEPEAAVEAIRALASLTAGNADQDLAEVSRHSSSEAVSLEALRGLAAWPTSEIAVGAVLDASRSDTHKIRRQAFASLGAFTLDAATDRLLQAARGELNQGLLDTIRGGLEDSVDERVTPMLVDMLRRAVKEDASFQLQGLLRSLYNRDDPTALAGFADLVDAQEPPSFRTINGLAAHLGRDRSPESGVIRRVLGGVVGGVLCGGPRWIDPLAPGTRTIQAVSPARTVRCWNAPGAVDAPGFRRRLPEGTLVSVREYFERGDELWVEVLDSSWTSCWIRDREITRAWPGEATHEATQLEFDIRVSELELPGAIVLQEARLLEIIEPEKDEIVGVGLRVEAVEELDLARSICDAGECGGGILLALDRAASRPRSGR